MTDDPVGLVRAAQAGDTIAMNDLLDHLSGYVGRICASIALDSGPDATQEALVAVFRALRGLRDPAALHGWCVRSRSAKLSGSPGDRNVARRPNSPNCPPPATRSWPAMSATCWSGYARNTARS